MFKKMIKLLTILFVMGVVSVISAYFASKFYFTDLAKDKAQAILAEVEKDHSENETRFLVELTREVYELFQPEEPSNHWQLRLRPYLTHSKLPSFVRYQDGVIETLVETGLCDNAARYLHFVLAQKGYKSAQWNMVTDQNAHSILIVYLENGKVALLDPMYGIVGLDQAANQFLSPDELKARMHEGEPLEKLFLKLDDNSEVDFYRNFASARMGVLGEPLEIVADIPYVDGDAVLFGELNGKERDVSNAGAHNGMSPFWHYAGHKYDRSWVRILRAHQDIRLEFILVSDVEESVITSDKIPQIDGRIMRWDLSKGDVLRFYDGKAKRSWERMNSYINIDQIAIHRR